jgi:hypothetical protein
MPQDVKKHLFFDDHANDPLAKTQAVVKVMRILVCAAQKQKSHLAQVAFSSRRIQTTIESGCSYA